MQTSPHKALRGAPTHSGHRKRICWEVRGGGSSEETHLSWIVACMETQAEEKGYLGSLLGGEVFCPLTHRPWEPLIGLTSYGRYQAVKRAST